MGIDEQRGHVGAVAGEGHEAVFGVGDWFFVGGSGVSVVICKFHEYEN